VVHAVALDRIAAVVTMQLLVTGGTAANSAYEQHRMRGAGVITPRITVSIAGPRLPWRTQGSGEKRRQSASSER
jgi:hypothetical protein